MEAGDPVTCLTTEGSGVGLWLWWLFNPIWSFGGASNQSFFSIIFPKCTVKKGTQNSYL